MDFFALKLMIIDATGLAKDALHVHIGLAAFILTRLVWRGRWGWLAAWVVVLIGATTGEWLDARAEIARGAPAPDATHWHDIWNTMLWPSVLLLVGPWLHRSVPNTDAAAPAATDETADPLSGENREQPLEQA